MDFIDKIQEIANRIPKQIDRIETEEATKNAFIMPFIAALGYDVFNPFEVVPEFTVDVGTKKGEKVDYAIKKDDQVIMLIECKHNTTNLNNVHATQLYRYFSVSDARFGVLTNGIQYKIYSDIEEPNKMDSKPFFIFNLLDYDETHLEELKKFTKSVFDLDNILTTASQLKYTNAIKKIFADEIEKPSDDFIRYFVSRVFSGVKTQAVIEQFSTIVKDALSQFVREKINDRLKSALDVDHADLSGQSAGKSSVEEKISDNGIVTTAEEIEAYNIVKAIVREVVEPGRVFMRDRKSYCGILLDDSNRTPICRLHFNCAQKYIGLFIGKEETRAPIGNLNEIFSHAESLKNRILELTEGKI